MSTISSNASRPVMAKVPGKEGGVGEERVRARAQPGKVMMREKVCTAWDLGELERTTAQTPGGKTGNRLRVAHAVGVLMIYAGHPCVHCTGHTEQGMEVWGRGTAPGMDG
jgi:hypothetical protein